VTKRLPRSTIRSMAKAKSATRKGSKKGPPPAEEHERDAAPPRPPAKKLVPVRFTPVELLHLRDLFGILLPPAATKTLSQALAERTGRSMVEACLWRKLTQACMTAGIPMGDDAPDFVVAPAGVPELTVSQIEADGAEGSGDDDAASVLAQALADDEDA
jgi:hypothetical protein